MITRFSKGGRKIINLESNDLIYDRLIYYLLEISHEQKYYYDDVSMMIITTKMKLGRTTLQNLLKFSCNEIDH